MIAAGLRFSGRTFFADSRFPFDVSSGDQMDFDLTECLARIRQNDQPAARELVERLYPLVIKIVRANLPRRASEEDLAQEIFMKMFANLDQYHGTSPIEHWVSRIAVNHCLNAIRAQAFRQEWRMADLSPEAVEALEKSSAAADQPDPAAALGAREVVERLLGALSPADQLVIRWLEMEDRSVAEIKAMTGWSSTSIRVRAFRARRKLNRLFGQLHHEGNL